MEPFARPTDIPLAYKLKFPHVNLGATHIYGHVFSTYERVSHDPTVKLLLSWMSPVSDAPSARNS